MNDEAAVADESGRSDDGGDVGVDVAIARVNASLPANTNECRESTWRKSLERSLRPVCRTDRRPGTYLARLGRML